MIRKILAAGALGFGLLVGATGVVDAQESPAAVLPSVVTPAPQVQGAPLARTGGDINGELYAGAGLIAAGMAFAVTARHRRRAVEFSGV